MSMQSHLAELERRHAEMERKIEDAQLHPSTDSLELADMKRQKLKIKDEIERIRQEYASLILLREFIRRRLRGVFVLF